MDRLLKGELSHVGGRGLLPFLFFLFGMWMMAGFPNSHLGPSLATY